MLYSGPPGWESLPISPVGMSKKRAVRPFFIAMIDAAPPRAVHAGKGFKIASGVHYGDIHLGTDLSRVLRLTLLYNAMVDLAQELGC